MLIAHLVPGYFAADHSQKTWPAEWSNNQRRWLWTAALVSTFAPDMDVIYNALFRGFINHSWLWTHSLFLHLGVGLVGIEKQRREATRLSSGIVDVDNRIRSVDTGDVLRHASQSVIRKPIGR